MARCTCRHTPAMWRQPAKRVVASLLKAGSQAATAAECASTSGRGAQGPGWLRSAWTDSRGYEHFGGRGNTGVVVWDQGGRGGGRGIAKWVVLGSVAAGTWYYRSCIEEVPYTHRKHAILFVTERMEKAMGEQTFAHVKAEAAVTGALLPNNHPLAQLVKMVGLRIAQVASDGYGGGKWEHMKNLNWEFAVIESPQVNAFVAPGGKVVVYTGLLRLMDIEDELAAVLAHETSHVLARHHAERLTQANLIALLNVLIRLVLGIPVPSGLLVLGMFLPYSRRAEKEADAIGVRLVGRACYDPDANVTMLQKLNAQEKAMEQAGISMPAFLRTHPLTEERVRLVRALLPEAYRLYHESGCDIARDWLDAALWRGHVPVVAPVVPGHAAVAHVPPGRAAVGAL